MTSHGDTPGSTSRAPRNYLDQAHHWLILLGATAVMFLSFGMNIRGERNVVLSLVNHPVPELCALYRITGIDCPGCGLTRSFISLAHGQPSRAWHYNPTAFVLFPLFAIQLPYRSIQIWRVNTDQAEWDATLFHWIWAPVLAMLLSQWVVKLSLRFMG